MDDKTLQFLNAMADKLGTTATHLWGVLVRQAPIAAATDAVFYLVLSCVFGAAVWSLLRAHKKWSAQTDGVSEGQGIALVVLGGATALMLGIVIMSFGVDLPHIIAGFFNPEYWALQRLLRLK